MVKNTCVDDPALILHTMWENGASYGDIKAKYKKLMKLYHPDKHLLEERTCYEELSKNLSIKYGVIEKWFNENGKDATFTLEEKELEKINNDIDQNMNEVHVGDYKIAILKDEYDKKMSSLNLQYRDKIVDSYINMMLSDAKNNLDELLGIIANVENAGVMGIVGLIESNLIPIEYLISNKTVYNEFKAIKSEIKSAKPSTIDIFNRIGDGITAVYKNFNIEKEKKLLMMKIEVLKGSPSDLYKFLVNMLNMKLADLRQHLDYLKRDRVSIGNRYYKLYVKNIMSECSDILKKIQEIKKRQTQLVKYVNDGSVTRKLLNSKVEKNRKRSFKNELVKGKI